MARSYRTAPSNVLARRRFRKDKDGYLVEPRVVQRKPYPGDIHPLTRKHIRAMMRRLPLEYFYGLSMIELRPRTSQEIGNPYGFYLNDEKRIILYSCPWPKWTFRSFSQNAKEWLESHGAQIDKVNKEWHVKWTRKIDVAYFVYEVFLHELGHHFQNQYRNKRKHPGSPAAKESSADRHAWILSKTRAFRIWHEITESSENDDS